MFDVEPSFQARLKELRVRVDVPDGDTVLLQNVPPNNRFFNKERINLLIKRPREGMPYLICVDEDLDYTGTDLNLSRAFVAGQRQQGWRVLFVAHYARESIETAIEEALAAVGFDGREPELRPRLAAAKAGSLGNALASFTADLSTKDDEETIGRQEQIEQVISNVLGWQSRLSLIVGESGVGKTNLVRAVARRLRQCDPAFRVVTIEMGALMSGTLFHSERENLLIELLHDLNERPKSVLVMEHLEMALMDVPRGHLLLGEALDHGARLIGTTLPKFRSRFEIEPLMRRLQMIEVAELSLTEALETLQALRTRIAEHHHIAIEETLLDSIIRTSQSLTGRFPAKAISLLDGAASRAVLAGEAELSLFDVYTAAAAVDGNDE